MMRNYEKICIIYMRRDEWDEEIIKEIMRRVWKDYKKISYETEWWKMSV